MRQLSDTRPPSTSDDANAREGAPATSKRRYWHHRPTETHVIEADRLSAIPSAPGRYYVLGLPTASGGLDEWLDVSGEDVSVFLDGHYPVIRHGGRTITDSRLWWAVDGADTTTAAAAWRWVEDALRAAWRDPEVCLLATPGTTGRDLWLRTEAADGCPIMSEEAQRLVRSTAAQGRIETYPPRAATLPALYEYDLRIAYAAVLRGLPMGEPVEGLYDLGEIVSGARARALVRFRVPADWSHVGLLSIREDDGSLSWPTAPGWHGETWADGCEIALAVREGWTVEVVRSFGWPRTGEPLRAWSERLLAILSTAARKLDGPLYAHVRAMVRAVVLHTVGAFHGAPQRVTRRAESLDLAPIGAEALRLHDDGSVSWREHKGAAWPEACHPEWSAHVWSRNRTRLLRTPGGGGMLSADPTTLVAVRTDAVYTTAPTHWQEHDDGKPGRWVLKSSRLDPVPWPANGTDLLDVKGR